MRWQRSQGRGNRKQRLDSLNLYFANVTNWGNKAGSKILEQTGHHIKGVVETHTPPDRVEQEKVVAARCGYKAAMSTPAADKHLRRRRTGTRWRRCD